MSEHITHSPTVKRLERSSSNRVIAGVCGGLGHYFDLNPNVFRLGIVVLTLLGGAGILVYLAAVLVLPAEGSERSIAADVLAERRDRSWPVVALGLVGIALAVLLTRAGTWPSAGAGWVLVLIAGLAVLWASRGERRGRRIAIVAGGALATVTAICVAAAAVAFAWFNVSLGDGVGDQRYEPTSIAAIKPSYKLGIGDLRVDLSKVPANAPVHVKAHVGIGELKVIVPSNASIVVDAHAKVGDLNVLNQHDDGRNATVHAGNGNTLYLDARVGAGRIDVVRAG